ncbi:hypothetical protein GCM10010358_09650 [Streptomyces minutiscleroticus]|uniref:Uncharacterized protein n=1 Tax=Streptomyces minutiscleroticus TaxID=68238 RepID=A0A918KBL9_9ACTN|nr:hypothetical protein GCM10010358_09650 [Streptomyces minutiscleroticus]
MPALPRMRSRMGFSYVLQGVRDLRRRSGAGGGLSVRRAGRNMCGAAGPAGSSGPVRVALIVREGHVRVKEKGRAEATDAVN